ncbi:MAG TPA: FAD-binding oxidoreductase [Nitrospiraceae bacterium]|nr:FAD-binding oxidoreductase [Nitrospiraceae bacterium]
MPIQVFKATVSRVCDLTHDVREIDLTLTEPLRIDFKAGQFISFEVMPAGAARPLVRPYSIASPPSRSGIVTLLFNLVPNGPGSTYLFSLRTGDSVSFKGTAGHFYLRGDLSRHHLFVATGTGIAPVRSMLLHLLEGTAHPPTVLYWGLRSRRDLYYLDELEALSRAHPHFQYLIALSRPDEAWTGETGRVTKLVEERVQSVANLTVYLCGNSGMINEVTGLLNKVGLCPIYREKYYDDKGKNAVY